MSTRDSNILAILGGGGYAAEVVDAALAAGWSVTGVYDDDPNLIGKKVSGIRCAGSIDDFWPSDAEYFVVAIGNNKIRKQLYGTGAKCCKRGGVVIHPSAVIGSGAILGEGSYIGAGAFVGPNSDLGKHSIVNVCASVGHDAKLGNYAQLCPGARLSGGSKVGEGGFLGSNSVLAPSIGIGAWAQVSACSFVHRNVPSRAVASGVPARIHQI